MNKPRFYHSDLQNYTPEFLQEIILWQKEEIERLKKELGISDDNHGPHVSNSLIRKRPKSNSQEEIREGLLHPAPADSQNQKDVYCNDHHSPQGTKVNQGTITEPSDTKPADAHIQEEKKA